MTNPWAELTLPDIAEAMGFDPDTYHGDDLYRAVLDRRAHEAADRANPRQPWRGGSVGDPDPTVQAGPLGAADMACGTRGPANPLERST